MRVRLAVVMLVGCGRIGFGDRTQPDAAPPVVVVGVVDGSRLHADHWVTNDGVAVFERWYDTVLDTPCDWNLVKGRCLPHAHADAFADAACTIPAVRALPDCALPKVVLVPATATAYEVGEQIANPYVGTGGCVPASDGAAYYALGAVADDRLVTGAAMTTPIGDGFALVEIVGEDGSRQQYDVATADSNTCDLIANRAGNADCVPRDADQLAEFTHTYMDSACTVEVVEDGTAPYAEISFVSDPCGGRGTAVGGRVAGTKVYVRDSTGACVARAMASTGFGRLTDLGGPVWTPVDVSVGDRLRSLAWRSPGGALVSRGFYDATLQVGCRPTVDADTGRAVCVPSGVATGVTASQSANCGSPPTEFDVTCGVSILPMEVPETCRGRTAHFMINSAPIAPPMSFVAGGTCLLVDAAQAQFWSHAVWAPYDASGLPELALVHD